MWTYVKLHWSHKNRSIVTKVSPCTSNDSACLSCIHPYRGNICNLAGLNVWLMPVLSLGYFSSTHMQTVQVWASWSHGKWNAIGPSHFLCCSPSVGWLVQTAVQEGWGCSTSGRILPWPIILEEGGGPTYGFFPEFETHSATQLPAEVLPSSWDRESISLWVIPWSIGFSVWRTSQELGVLHLCQLPLEFISWKLQYLV